MNREADPRAGDDAALDANADDDATPERRTTSRDAADVVPVVSLFGAPALVDHVGRRYPVGRRETQLLAYLALHRNRPHPRPVLAAVLWPDLPEARARKSLSTTLWRLRRDFEDRGIERDHLLLRTGPDTVELVVRRTDAIDVALFEAALDPLPEAALANPARHRDAEAALALYQGDLMEGFYEEWAVLHRERLRLVYLNALGSVMIHHRASDPARALAAGEAILRVDPLRESVHRELMRIHLDLGHRARALRQYEACRALLRDELGVSPMEETRALHLRILREESPAPAPESPGNPTWRPARARTSPSARIHQLSAELERVARHLERARRMLHPEGDPPKDPEEG